MKKIFTSIVLFGMMGFSLLGSRVYSQLDTTLAYCNLFYVTSGNQDVFPFEDDCFVNLNYIVQEYPKVRVVGPIHNQTDLFRQYDWSIQFHFPKMDKPGMLNVELPVDLTAESFDIPAGKFFATICDNRDRRFYGEGSHKIDYVAVEGKIKINEYTEKSSIMKHPELQAQMDLYFQKVVVVSEGTKPVGDKIRLKCVLVVENKEE